MRIAGTPTLLLTFLVAVVAFAPRAHAQRTDEGFRTKEPANSEKGTAGQLEPGAMMEKYGADDGSNGQKPAPAVVEKPAPTPAPGTIPSTAPAKDLRPAFLGVHYEVSRSIVAGSYVTDVEPNTPAASVGIRQGDVIMKADGQELDQLEDLLRIISTKHVGDKVALTVNRAGKVFTVSPALAERKRDLMTYQFNSPDGIYGLPNGSTIWIEDGMDKARPFLGVTFRREEKILSINGQDVVKGPASKDLIVADVAEGSTAKVMGILPGDIITAMNGRPLQDFNTLTTMLDGMTVGQEIRLTYLRSGRAFNSVGRLRAHPGGNPGMGMRSTGRPTIGGPNPSADYGVDRVLERVKEMAAEAHANNARVVTVVEDPVSASEVANLRNSSGMDFPANSTLPIDDFRILPYGADGTYSVQFGLTTKGTTLIYVLDSEGSIAYSESLAAFSGIYRKTFKLAADKPGSYFVQISQSGRSFTRKVTLQ